MSRFLPWAIGIYLASTAVTTLVFARGFAGVPQREVMGFPNRGFLGFPAGGVGGFAGGHTYGMHPVGMPGRNEFDTLYPVTLPNLGAKGRLQPYGLPPMGICGDFHPGGLPGMGGFAGLHPVNMPDVYSTPGVRMGGTVTGDGGSARLANDAVPPGGFETGHLRTDPSIAAKGTSPDELQSDELRTFTAAERFADEPTSETHVGEARSPRADGRHMRLPTDAGMHPINELGVGRGLATTRADAAKPDVAPAETPRATRRDNTAQNHALTAPNGRGLGGHVDVNRFNGHRTVRLDVTSHGTVGSWLAAVGGGTGTSGGHDVVSEEVSRWCIEHAVYTPAWHETHASAWCPAAYDAATWSRMAWMGATWETAIQWLAWESPPTPADNGFDFYRHNHAAGSSSQAAADSVGSYEQASTLANSNRDGQDNQDDPWLPLGVFALLPTGQQEPQMIMQLALNRQGVIRGNAYDQTSDRNLAVRGAVDESSQRIAWTVGNDRQVVFETDFCNLTRDTASAWVHNGSEQTSPYLMIRVQSEQ